MDDVSAQTEQLDDSDLEVAFHGALSILGIGGLKVGAAFKPFASVKTTVRVDKFSRTLSAQVSDAYRLAPREVLLGLALDMCMRLFGKRVDSQYVDEFKKFSKKGALLRLSDSIRMVRGRKRKENHEGEYYDLMELGCGVFSKYSFLLGLSRMPRVFWNDRGGRRILAFYDRAFDSVMVSRIFDSPKVPRFVLEYLLLHEFLHSKYEPLYERGKSSRVIVHSPAFKKDEQKFELYGPAEEWLLRNVGRLY